MKIVLATEVYPPRAGGAGWSTRALALALEGAGHDVRVVTTAEGPDTDGPLRVTRLVGVSGPFRRGRMTRIFRQALSEAASGADALHAQHSLSALGALSLEGRPRTLVTVRDHWPVCFWSTRISQGALCPACSPASMSRCIEGRLPRISSPVAIAYMTRDLSAKRTALSRADAVIAVSEAIARELREAAIPRVTVLPNIVDTAEVRRIADEPPGVALPERFLLFVGKLETNKGVLDLIPALVRARTSLPLVVLGHGGAEAALRRDAEAKGVSLILPGWTERADVLRAMRRAEALVFPSTWPEPLSRVLLEALALGVPIAAMATGGTAELIEDGRSGLLATDADSLGDAVTRIVHDAPVRSSLQAGASARAAHFSPEALTPRYEALYRGGR